LLQTDLAVPPQSPLGDTASPIATLTGELKKHNFGGGRSMHAALPLRETARLHGALENAA
jgi:hypothetical protein